MHTHVKISLLLCCKRVFNLLLPFLGHGQPHVLRSHFNDVLQVLVHAHPIQAHYMQLTMGCLAQEQVIADRLLNEFLLLITICLAVGFLCLDAKGAE